MDRMGILMKMMKASDNATEQNSLHISETFKTLKGNLTDLFSFLLSIQTLIMITLPSHYISANTLMF